MSLRSWPLVRADFLRVHLVDLLDDRIAQNVRGEVGAAGRQQRRKGEDSPENQGGQSQRGVVAQPPGGRIEQRPPQVAKLETRGAVDQVVRPRDQRLQVGHRLARQIMVFGEHQVGARRAVKLTQPQHLRWPRACAGLQAAKAANRALARPFHAARAVQQPSSQQFPFRLHRRRRSLADENAVIHRAQDRIGGSLRRQPEALSQDPGQRLGELGAPRFGEAAPGRDVIR